MTSSTSEIGLHRGDGKRDTGSFFFDKVMRVPPDELEIFQLGDYVKCRFSGNCD